eukprot:gene13267-39126_t
MWRAWGYADTPVVAAGGTAQPARPTELALSRAVQATVG